MVGHAVEAHYHLIAAYRSLDALRDFITKELVDAGLEEPPPSFEE
jgi:hypothetical protein